jgi:transposase-like protein
MDELASLNQSARENALERFRIIQPCLEKDRSLGSIARETGIPYRTINRWMSLYRQFGLAGLARKPREDTQRENLRLDRDRTRSKPGAGIDSRFESRSRRNSTSPDP